LNFAFVFNLRRSMLAVILFSGVALLATLGLKPAQ
jgi:hypothetical protein